MNHETPSYRTVEEIIAANRKAGFCWFSPETTAYWHTRVLSGVYSGRYFVTSDRPDWSGARLYSVRQVNSDASIQTVGEFAAYSTAAAARAAAKKRARNDAVLEASLALMGELWPNSDC